MHDINIYEWLPSDFVIGGGGKELNIMLNRQSIYNF